MVFHGVPWCSMVFHGFLGCNLYIQAPLAAKHRYGANLGSRTALVYRIILKSFRSQYFLQNYADNNFAQLHHILRLEI